MFEIGKNWEYHLLFFLSALILSPFMNGVINRVKAFYAGRQGQPLLQFYYDIFKLLRKGTTYSKTCTWIFRLSPIISLGSVLTALWILCSPLSRYSFSFQGDIVLAFYFLALARFATVLAALDTGSSFEGMGASRELFLAPYSELGLFIVIIAGTMLSGAFNAKSVFGSNLELHITLLMIVVLFIFLLVENCRVPVDDPNTHLELTMIHEVMVLDYSGPDLAFIFYGASLKFWTFAMLISSLLCSLFDSLSIPARFLINIFFIILVSMSVGTVESVMARFRFEKVHRMLILASALAALILFVSAGSKI